jgi:hypothetical protein
MLDKPSENIDPIEDLIRKRFQEHEEMPPSRVWDAIAKKLDASLIPEIPFWKKTSFQLGVGAVIGVSLLAYFYFTNQSAEKKEEKTIPQIIKEEKQIPVSITPKTVEELPVVASTKNIKQKSESIQKTIESKPEQVPTSVAEKIIPEEIAPIELPVKEEKIVEPEPTNLYDQLKKNQKGKEKRDLFIEKKE